MALTHRFYSLPTRRGGRDSGSARADTGVGNDVSREDDSDDDDEVVEMGAVVALSTPSSEVSELSFPAFPGIWNEIW